MPVKGKRASKPEPKSKGKKLDPKEDFEEPVKKEPEQLAMAETAEVAEPPKSLIINEKMQAEFVRPRFEKDDDEHLTGLEFSLALSDDHNGHVPESVMRHWTHMRQGGVKRQELTDIDPQTIDVFMVPDGKSEGSELHFTALIERARIEEVTETGNGAERKYFRFLFCAKTAQTKNTVSFGAWKHGEQVWLEMKETQGSLV